MNSLILDAGPLITACKFSVAGRLVVDHILAVCSICVTTSVHDEVVVAGAHYPDAHAAQERIAQGRIRVLAPPTVPELGALLGLYGLGAGERDSILLTEHPELVDAVLVLDDHLAYLVSDRLGRRQRFLLDAIVDLVQADALGAGVAIEMVEAVRSRYPTAFVEHTVILLRG